jgi:hypothetical protein
MHEKKEGVHLKSLLIVANMLCNHTSDKQQSLPTTDAIPAVLGTPKTAALNAGYPADVKSGHS